MIKDVIIPVAVLCFPDEVFGQGRPLLPYISFAIGWKLSVLNPSASFVRFATEAHIHTLQIEKSFDCLTWLGQVGLIGRHPISWLDCSTGRRKSSLVEL